MHWRAIQRVSDAMRKPLIILINLPGPGVCWGSLDVFRTDATGQYCGQRRSWQDSAPGHLQPGRPSPPAIDADRLPGQKGVVPREKKSDHRRNLFRGAEAADRDGLGALGKTDVEIVAIFAPVG